MRIQLLSAAASTVNNNRPQGRATGTITVVAVASLADGDYFTIIDSKGRTWVFEYDVTGDGVTAGRVQVNVSTDTTATHVRDRTITAINAATAVEGGVTEAIDITAAIGGSAVINLRAKSPGTVGNRTITENVANAGFTVSGMSGAIDALTSYAAESAVLIPRPKQGYLTDTALLEFYTVAAASVTQTLSARVWGRSRGTGEFYPLGIGVSANRGLINDGITIDELGTDDIHHAEPLDLTDDLDALFIQIVTLGGTGTLLDCWLTSGR